MNNTGRRVAKNAGVMITSQFITWALAVILMIYMPRYLGVEAIGRFQLASSLWAIAAIVITLGMDTLLTKEIARDPNWFGGFFGTSLILRSIVYCVGFGGVALYARVVGYPLETVYAIYIIGIANFFTQLSSACSAVLLGLERMEFVSLADIISKAFITVVTIAILWMGHGVLAAAGVVVVGSMISSVIQLASLRYLQPLNLRFDWSKAKWMARASFPYLVNTGIRTIYIQVDVVIISLLVTETVIGWYSVASRLFATLLFIPTVLTTAIFPAMSRIHTATPEAMPQILRKNFDLMFLLGVPIGLGVFVIANPLVVLLFGADFAPSGPVLASMGLVLIVTYQNMLVGQYLVSSDQQNTWTLVMAIATLATIPLDILLIPFSQRMFNNGAIGGGLSFILTEAGMTFIGLLLLPKGTLNRSNVWLAARVCFSGLVMAAASWWLREKFILIPIVVGAVTYTCLILLLRVVPKEDWLLIKSLLQSAWARVRKPNSAPSGAGGQF